jgi:hypothetical protein
MEDVASVSAQRGEDSAAPAAPAEGAPAQPPPIEDRPAPDRPSPLTVA